MVEQSHEEARQDVLQDLLSAYALYDLAVAVEKGMVTDFVRKQVPPDQLDVFSQTYEKRHVYAQKLIAQMTQYGYVLSGDGATNDHFDLRNVPRVRCQ